MRVRYCTTVFALMRFHSMNSSIAMADAVDLSADALAFASHATEEPTRCRQDAQTYHIPRSMEILGLSKQPWNLSITSARRILRGLATLLLPTATSIVKAIGPSCKNARHLSPIRSHPPTRTMRRPQQLPVEIHTATLRRTQHRPAGHCASSLRRVACTRAKAAALPRNS